jgi:hypothetical protein
MPSLSKNFKFTVYTGIGTTGTSVAVAYPLYPIGISGTQQFVSSPNQGAGYYGTSNGLHSLTINTTPSFRGTATIQATLAVDPAESDWFDVNNATFTYTTTSTGYVPELLMGSNPEGETPRTEYVNFTGQFTWLRTRLDIDEGALMSVRYNF